MRNDRVVKLGLAVLALTGLALPLWGLNFNAPIYGQSWMTITVYGSGSVQGPVDQVNIANHYVGLQEIQPDDMIVLKFVPLIYISSAILMILSAWRLSFRVTAVLYLLILFVVPAGIQYWLYLFGHTIKPDAPIAMNPFTPYVMGSYEVANFKIVSYLSVGYALLAGILVLGYITQRRWGLHN